MHISLCRCLYLSCHNPNDNHIILNSNFDPEINSKKVYGGGKLKSRFA